MVKKTCLAIAMLVNLVVTVTPQVEPTTAARATGTVQGIVTRAGTNDPIPDVEIQIPVRGGPTMSLEQAQSLVAFVNQGNTLPDTAIEQAMDIIAKVAQGGAAPQMIPPFKAITDSNGRFSISNVPVGEAQISAQLAGYFGPGGNGYTPTNAITHAIVSEQKTVSVRLSLIPGATVSGRILGPDGKPLADAMVRALQQTYRFGHAVLEPIAPGKTTDDRGEFRLYRLPPGEYFITALERPRGRSSGDNAPTEVPALTHYPGVTDATRAVRMDLKGGEDITGVNFQTVNVATAKITGKVTSAFVAVPLPGARGGIRQPIATISIVPHDSRDAGPAIMYVPGPGVTTAGPDGSFEISGIGPGVYDLIARLPATYGWANLNSPERALAAWAFGRTTVEVRSRNAENVAIVVSSGVDVPGRVLVDGRPASPAISLMLSPEESLSHVQDEQTAGSLAQIDRYKVDIKPDGSFTFPVLPEGRYRVRASLSASPGARPDSARMTLPRNAYLADVRQGGVSVYDNGLVVGTQTAIPLEVLINTDGGTMNGQISGLDQSYAATEITAVLVPAENRRQNSELYFIAHTDADNRGRFSFSSVPPGTYTLFSWADVKPGQYENAEFLRQNETRGVAVTILANAVVSVQVGIIP